MVILWCAGRFGRDNRRGARRRSSRHVGRIGLLERENAAIVNSCLRSLASDTVSAFRRAIAEMGITAPLYLTQNDGTLMSADFAERRVDKVYIAVVAGHLDGEGLVDLPLAADWPNRPRQQVDPERGKPSQTRWRVLAHEGPHTRVRLEPLTGRSHQLRVHMAQLGHAILGDALYASPDIAAASPRLLLHASELRIGDNYFTAPPGF